MRGRRTVAVDATVSFAILAVLLSASNALAVRRSPSLHRMSSPGTVLDSTYYDWQSNGGLDDHLALYDAGGNVQAHGVMMVSHDPDLIDRCLSYYFWDGTKWDDPAGELCVFSPGGYCLSLLPDGSLVSSGDADPDGMGTRPTAAIDSSAGARRFSNFATSQDTVGVWPKITVNGDGSIVMTGETIGYPDTIPYPLMWVRAEDRASGFGSWHFFSDIAPNWRWEEMGPHTIHSGSGSQVGVVVPEYAGAVRFLESSDNGITLDSLTIAPADTAGLPSGPDSTAARLGWINSDITYVGGEPHVVWSAGQGAHIGGNYVLLDFKATIFHWSPSTGIDTVAVAWTQSFDSMRADYVLAPDSHLSVDWPSIGLAADGKALICAFTSTDTTDIDPANGVGYLDIWMTVSGDGGETWTDRVDVTNLDGTVMGWDDRYPSVAKINYDCAADPGKDVYLIYQSDDQAGTYVRGTEAGPANMDDIKFLGVDLGLMGIGGAGRTGGTPALPRAFSLSQNYPNPFNPSTTIRYHLAERSRVRVRIYDLRGRMVHTLDDGIRGPGDYALHWDGRDGSGRSVSSGVYIYRMETDRGFRSTRKMVLLE